LDRSTRADHAMPLAEATFLAAHPDPKNEHDLRRAVDDFVAEMARVGRVWGEELTARVEGGVRVAVSVARRDALEDPAATQASPEAFEAWGRIVELCGVPTRWTVQGDDPTGLGADWRTAPALTLFTNSLMRTSPVRHGLTGDPVPLYQLPLSHEEAGELGDWMETYRALDQLFMESGPLRIEAYERLASVAGEFLHGTRQLALMVEERSGLPTFTFVNRAFGRPKEFDRPCPGCGGAWSNQRPVPGLEAIRNAGFQDGLQRFQFLCVPCRLVSYTAFETDEAAQAFVHIGEWPGDRAAG
jgi:predicted  nucleic acid-binding Zn ribbon protein